MKCFDREKFTRLFNHHKGEQSLSSIAIDTGLSKPTLSRVSRGAGLDINTFFILCNWMKVPPDFFINDEINFEFNTIQKINNLLLLGDDLGFLEKSLLQSTLNYIYNKNH